MDVLFRCGQSQSPASTQHCPLNPLLSHQTFTTSINFLFTLPPGVLPDNRCIILPMYSLSILYMSKPSQSDRLLITHYLHGLNVQRDVLLLYPSFHLVRTQVISTCSVCVYVCVCLSNISLPPFLEKRRAAPSKKQTIPSAICMLPIFRPPPLKCQSAELRPGLPVRLAGWLTESRSGRARLSSFIHTALLFVSVSGPPPVPYGAKKLPLSAHYSSRISA